MKKYLYKFGDIEVCNRFESPTKESFSKWRSDFLKNVDLSNYNVLFMGNAAETFYGVSKIPTYDVDIILSGEIDSYKNLSNILRKAFKLGLTYNLCIDIFHIDKNVFEHKFWEDYHQIRFYDTIEIVGKSDKLIEGQSKVILPNGLYKFLKKQSNTNSYNKHISRIKSGDYLSLRFDLKTMELISYN